MAREREREREGKNSMPLIDVHFYLNNFQQRANISLNSSLIKKKKSTCFTKLNTKDVLQLNPQQMNEHSGLNHYVHTHQDLKHSTTIIKTRHMSGIDNEYRLEDKDLACVLISFV